MAVTTTAKTIGGGGLLKASGRRAVSASKI
jgi:hypothetical protein